MLETFCGSPAYAAPGFFLLFLFFISSFLLFFFFFLDKLTNFFLEMIRGSKYFGCEVDIWSIGHGYHDIEFHFGLKSLIDKSFDDKDLVSNFGFGLDFDSLNCCHYFHSL